MSNVIVTSRSAKKFSAKKFKKLCFVLAGLAALYFECRVTCVCERLDISRNIYRDLLVSRTEELKKHTYSGQL